MSEDHIAHHGRFEKLVKGIGQVIEVLHNVQGSKHWLYLGLIVEMELQTLRRFSAAFG